MHEGTCQFTGDFAATGSVPTERRASSFQNWQISAFSVVRSSDVALEKELSMKFDPKIYQNKHKVWTPVAGANLISRLWVWNEDKREYREPKGKRYLARRRQEKDGTKKLVSSMHETLEAARTWQRSEPKPAETVKAVTEQHAKPTGPSFGEIVDEWKRRKFPSLSISTQQKFIIASNFY